MSDPVQTRCAPSIHVGVAELKVGAESTAALRVRALGSCVGLTVWDPVARAGGLLHYMLAQPRERELAEANPSMYAVTGVPALFRSVAELGAQRERLVVCAVGAAEPLDATSGFSIGGRNRAILRKLFWREGIPLHAEDTGGHHVRDLRLDLLTGVVSVRSAGQERRLWPR